MKFVKWIPDPNAYTEISKSKQMKSMPDKLKKSVSKAKENETSKKVSVKGSKANLPAVKKITTPKAESKPVENPLKTFSGYCICDKPERDDMIG